MVKSSEVLLTSSDWHPLDIQRKLVGNAGAAHNMASITVIGVGRILRQLLGPSSIEGLHHVGLEDPVEFSGNESWAEYAFFGRFETRIEAALEASRYLRGFLESESDLQHSPRISVGRSLYAAICGLQRTEVGRIYLDSKVKLPACYKSNLIATEFSTGKSLEDFQSEFDFCFGGNQNHVG